MNKEIFKKLQKLLTEETTGGFLVYHGSPNKILKFTLDQIEYEKTNEFGVGIYFTTTYSDAEYYASEKGFVHTVKISSGRFLDESEDIDHLRDLVEKLIKMGDWETAAYDWAEDPDQGYQLMLDNLFNYTDSEADLFQQIWYDVYRNDSKGFIRNCVKLGIDGLVRKVNVGSHVIVYNTNLIKIREIEKVETTNESKQENKMDKFTPKLNLEKAVIKFPNNYEFNQAMKTLEKSELVGKSGMKYFKQVGDSLNIKFTNTHYFNMGVKLLGLSSDSHEELQSLIDEVEEGFARRSRLDKKDDEDVDHELSKDAEDRYRDNPTIRKGVDKYHRSGKGKANNRKLQRFNKQTRSEFESKLDAKFLLKSIRIQDQKNIQNEK